MAGLLRNLVTKMRIPRRHPRAAAASRGLFQSQQEAPRMMYRSLHGYSYKDAKSINEKIKEFGSKWGPPLMVNSLGIASVMAFPYIAYQVVSLGLTSKQEEEKKKKAPKDKVNEDAPKKRLILGLVKAFLDQPGNLDLIEALMEKPLYEIEAWMDKSISEARMKGATMDEATVIAVKNALLDALAGTEEEEDDEDVAAA